MTNIGNTASTPISRYCISVGAILIIGSILAAAAPFNALVRAVTGGLPWLQVVLFVAVVTIGLYCAKQVNLPILPRQLAHPIAAISGISFIVALFAALLDSSLFRAILPQIYVNIFSDIELAPRLTVFMLKSFNEDIYYRLFFMSVLVWGMTVLFGRSNGTIPKHFYWIAIFAAQFTLVTSNTVAETDPSTFTAEYLIYVFLRFICPGLLWGFLFWRHGFVIAQSSHACVHIFLQPILGYTLGYR